jgi:transcriptional regulator with XRE-family HTH domain
MSGIERGVRNISVLKVIAIARALEVPPARLFSNP